MKSIKGARGTGPGAYLLYLLLIGLLVSGCGELKNEDARNSGGNVSLVFSVPGSGGSVSNKVFNKYVYQSFSSITVEIYSNNVLRTRDTFNVTQGTDATRKYDIDPGTGWTFVATAFSGREGAGLVIYSGQTTTDIPDGEDVTVRIPMVATDVTQQLVDDLNTSLNEFKNLVTSKGASLTQADLLPFFDPAYFDSGSNVNDETADMASDMPDLSGVYLYEILNYDQPNGIIDFQLQYWGSKNGTYESGVFKETFKKDASGNWLFYGNQRPAVTEFYYGMKTRSFADGTTDAGATPDTHFEAYSGTVSMIKVSAPFMNGTSIAQSVCDYWTSDNGRTMANFCSPPINMIATPTVGDFVNYEVTLTNTSTVSYSQEIGFVNATSALLITSPTGHYLDDAKLGSRLNVTWTNPFPEGEVRIRGTVCDFYEQCNDVDGTVTSATSGHISLPNMADIWDVKIKVRVHFRDEARSVNSYWFAGLAPPSGRFSIVSSVAREYAFSAAYDGTNYAVGVQGDTVHNASIGAQFIDQSGTKFGQGIVSTGRTGGIPSIVFTGTNYLIVWPDDAAFPNDDIYGMTFMASQGGGSASAPFKISSTIGNMDRPQLACYGGKCTIIWHDSSTKAVYGRDLNSDGTFFTSEYTVESGAASGNPGGSSSIAFDTVGNVMVVYDNGSSIRGSFGPNTSFTVAIKNQGSCRDWNPTALVFDGTNYLVVWNDHSDCALHPTWDVMAQFIDTAGNLVGSAFQVNSINTTRAALPFAAFDGTNYLVSWIDSRNDTNRNGICDAGESTCLDIYGQYINTSGALVGNEFAINSDPGNQVGTVAGFFNGSYLVLINNIDTFDGTVGDVYGEFITP